MTTLSISVPPELEHYILEKISSGVYHSPSEVMQEGLRLLSEQDELYRIRLEALKKEIAIGTEQLEKGEVAKYKDVEELAEKIKSEGRRRIALIEKRAE